MATRLKFYIETYGCQMNVADSEVVAAIMQTTEASTPALYAKKPKRQYNIVCRRLKH